MAAHPPPDRHNHEIRAGGENLPLQNLPGVRGVLEVPLPLGLSVEAETDTAFDERDFPRRRFDVRNAREVRGTLMLKLTILFYIGEEVMKSVIAWIRQPTTLQGLALLIFAAAGWFAKVLTTAEASPFVLSALPLIGIKDNTSTILHQTQANGAAIAAAPQGQAPAKP